jgi:opacity protein-like surface antigen/outer membrane protein OmpA-like peptidoglycan-associated protein
MASKKYLLAVSLIVFLQTFVMAQKDLGRSSWQDSSKVPTKSLPQFNEFMNNQYPYPVKPRNQWELSIGLGAAILSNDWSNDVGFGGSLQFRKALSHTFSLRPGFSYYSNSGGGFDYNTALQTDYKDNSMHVALDILTSLNTISHYRGNPRLNVYFVTGFEYFSTKITRSVAGGPFVDYTKPNATAGDNIGINLGIGFSYRLSQNVSLGLEFKSTITNNDKLETYRSPYSNANDAWSFISLKRNVNLGNKAKRVQPLWWTNPNNYVYSEMNNPKHMKLPKVVLPDADGDGVTDQFDLEPNTPKGAPVDSHGVAKDSDGDGVPDYKDKELLTPQKCFPVNADGIGTCPEPACCKEIKDMVSNMKVSPAAECNIGSLPSIHFKGNAKLSKDNEAVLAVAAAKINNNPTCKVKVIGYGASSKSAQQLSWERVNAVMKYLVEKQGISESRLVFNYGQDGDVNTVDLLGTTEDGPNNVPAPHPNLKTKN